MAKVAAQYFDLPDGLTELRNDIDLAAAMVARTARWVHPDAFRALPVWYPEAARGRPSYNALWTKVLRNTNRVTGQVVEKWEPNIYAAKALRAALGARRSPNWTTCHIWGIDDASFQKSNLVVRDPRFYSCVANLVLLPTPLKGFTDAIPEIKRLLRACAFNLYGWACGHESVADEAADVRKGEVPRGYPESWPTKDRRCLPPGTAPFTSVVQAAIKKRKAKLRSMLSNSALTHFPREEVKHVLSFWGVDLMTSGEP